jgi:hypothetical protein
MRMNGSHLKRFFKGAIHWYSSSGALTCTKSNHSVFVAIQFQNQEFNILTRVRK